MRIMLLFRKKKCVDSDLCATDPCIKILFSSWFISNQ